MFHVVHTFLCFGICVYDSESCLNEFGKEGREGREGRRR